MVKYVNGMIKRRNANNMLARNVVITHNLIKMVVIQPQCLAITIKVPNYVSRYHLKGKIVLEDLTN